MASSSRPEPADHSFAPAKQGRGLLVLVNTTVILIAVQFALAAFDAFTMDKTPSDNAYGAHALLGLVIAALTLVILAVVLVSRSARTHRRTLWLAVSLAVLAVAAQPALGHAGTSVPAVGAVHGLVAVVIFALAGWLAIETTRRRQAASRAGQGVRTRAASRTSARQPQRQMCHGGGTEARISQRRPIQRDM